MKSMGMRFKKCLLVCMVVMCSIVYLPIMTVAGTNFSDESKIPAWAHESVMTLVGNKILSGYSDGCFAPDDAVTYEQAITGIFNVFWLQKQANQLAQTTPPLSNVSSWAQGYVRLALQKQLLWPAVAASPIPAPTRYTDPAPRAWVAGFLSYALGYGQWNWDVTTMVPFNDLGCIPGDQRMMVYTAVDLGIASGTGDGRFDPAGTITRAQYAVMLNNAKRIADTGKSVRTYFPPETRENFVQPIGMGFFQRGQEGNEDEYKRRLVSDITDQKSYIQFLNMMSYVMDIEGNAENVDKSWGDTFFDDTVNLAHKNGIKTLLVLQNHDLSRFDPQIAHNLLADPGRQQKMINWLAEEIRQDGDSGINIDFEDLYNSDRDAFTRFVAKVSAEMKKNGWITVVSVLPKTNDLVDFMYYDYDKLGQYADYVFLMTYDQYNTYGTGPGPNYTVPFVEKNLKFALASVPPNKLLIGVGSHSWAWNDEQRNEYATWEIDHMLSGGKAISHRDAASNSPYATYQTDGGKQGTVYYQDLGTYKNEFDLEKKYHLGGYVLFPLGWEDDSLWAALKQSFN